GAIGPEYPARIGIDGDETLARAAVGDAHHFGSDAADSRLIFADDVAEQDHLRQRTATRLGRVANRTQVTLVQMLQARQLHAARARRLDRKSTRLNSSHVKISYAVFCLKKK